jgi:aminoglycoside phosphotransferase (APT) family kinase protein
MTPLSIADGTAAVIDWARSRGESVTSWRSRLLDAPNAERIVIECVLEGGADTVAAPRAYVSTCYSDGTGERTFAVMRAVEAGLQGLARPALLATPAALCYDSERRCLIQQRVDGIPLRELLDHEDAARHFAAAGRALAELHGLPLAAAPATKLNDHLRELIRPHPVDLADALPQQRRRILALMAEMEGLEQVWREHVVAAPVHRDFHLRQLFCGEERVWLIDWDLFAWGDPMLDVGNFMMVLETRAAGRSAVLGEAFLHGYFNGRRDYSRNRVPLYMAFNYLRRASKHYRLHLGDWAEDVDRMLTHAERCLATA